MAKIETNIQLVETVLNIANNYKTLYVYGCFGAPMNAKNKTKYCNHTEYNKREERRKMIQNASSNTFGFDCVCLIKGILWGWTGDLNHHYGGAVYCSNNVPDISANSMINKCTSISENFSNIEPGEVVWMDGHIGIYIGDGLAVESTPSWKNGVQITAVANIGPKAGYNRHKWTKHGKLPYIKYATSSLKSIEVVAKEVIQGKWGNGAVRKNKLIAAGYDYITVQSKVDELMKKDATPTLKSIEEIAKEVIQGKWGNGAVRKNKLIAAGYNYDSVKDEVNKILKNK